MTEKPRIRSYGSGQHPYCVAARMLLANKDLLYGGVPVGTDYELHGLIKSGELDGMQGINENA